MKISTQVAVIVALSSSLNAGTAPQKSSMQWNLEVSGSAVPEPALNDSTAAEREDTWLPFSQAPANLRGRHFEFVQYLLDANLELVDRVPDMPPSFATALGAATWHEPIANADERMTGGCVGEPGVPYMRLMLCAFSSRGGFILVEHGGLKPGAWMRLYESSGNSLMERAGYAFGQPDTRDLFLQLHTLVSKRDELFARLRHYLAERPEPTALQNGK